RPVGQAGRGRRPQLRAPCGVDEGARVRPPRPARADPRRAGLGRPDRAASCRRAPGRFARVVAANTGLPTGDQPMPEVWLRFREVVRTAPELSVSRLVQSGCQARLAPQVLAAYDAPFPGPAYAAAVRAMPDLVPAYPDDPAADANRAAWRRLAAWDRPFLVAFSDRDPITGGMAPVLKRVIPGAAGIEHPVLEGAGHFLQEDAGERLGGVI